MAGTGAQFLGRIRPNRRTPVLVRFADGSYLPVIGSVAVRIVEAQIGATCKDSTSSTGSYRLAILDRRSLLPGWGTGRALSRV
ncbi:hypothetical protein [Streptomyces kaempferi]|uniref:Uncharacterized protein n=1 Tax=Streptomyces kaempferi TaxID=333725 RepID=A0ABW3XWH3_9ACTN